MSLLAIYSLNIKRSLGRREKGHAAIPRPFHVRAPGKGLSNRHTRQIDIEFPIEYDTDIEAVQRWAAKEVGADDAVLLSWQLLKGAVRPS